MSHHDINSEKPNSASPFLLGAGVVLVLLVALAGSLLISRSSSPTDIEDSERAGLRTKNLTDLQSADTALLSSYGWNDQAKGIVHIPITKAMQLVLPTLNARTATSRQP